MTEWLNKLSRFRKNHSALLIVLIIGLVGIAIWLNLTLLIEAVSPRNLQAEAGTRTANATLVTDSSASGNQAVKFTAPAGACASSTSNTPDGPDPWGGCWPGPTSTGIAGCPALTTHNGDYVVGDNSTVQNMLINGQLRIPGKNVTIRCVRVVDNDSYFPIDTDYSDRTSASEAILERVEVSCNGSQIANAAMDLFQLTLRSARVYDCTDAYRIHSNVVIENSFCGDLRVEGDDGEAWHYDCIQTIGDSSNMTLRHNALDGRDTSDIALWPDVGPVDNVMVSRNLLIGSPGYKIYIGKAGLGPTTNITVSENRFGPNLNGDRPWNAGPCSITNASVTWTNNVWNADGSALPRSACAN